MGTMQQNTVTVSGNTVAVEAISRFIMNDELLVDLKESCGMIQYGSGEYAQFTVASSGSRTGVDKYEKHKWGIETLARFVQLNNPGYIEMHWISYGEEGVSLKEYNCVTGEWDSYNIKPDMT